MVINLILGVHIPVRQLLTLRRTSDHFIAANAQRMPGKLCAEGRPRAKDSFWGRTSPGNAMGMLPQTKSDAKTEPLTDGWKHGLRSSVNTGRISCNAGNLHQFELRNAAQCLRCGSCATDKQFELGYPSWQSSANMVASTKRTFDSSLLRCPSRSVRNYLEKSIIDLLDLCRFLESKITFNGMSADL